MQGVCRAFDFGGNFGEGDGKTRVNRGKWPYSVIVVTYRTRNTYPVFSGTWKSVPNCLTSRRSAVRARDRPPSLKGSTPLMGLTALASGQNPLPGGIHHYTLSPSIRTASRPPANAPRTAFRIGFHHQPHQLVECHRGLPAEHAPRFGEIRLQSVHFRLPASWQKLRRRFPFPALFRRSACDFERLFP